MENSTLRQIIRESIQNYIREIDEVAEVAATEARIRKMEEAIEERKNLINMEGLEETMHKMIDKKKIKEIEKEIKHLEKSLEKYKKQLEKMQNKGKKSEESESEETKEMVDEMAEDIKGNMEENYMEEEKPLNESFLYMQKLAGVITEAQYKAKKKALVENQLNENTKHSELKPLEDILLKNGYKFIGDDIGFSDKATYEKEANKINTYEISLFKDYLDKYPVRILYFVGEDFTFSNGEKMNRGQADIRYNSIEDAKKDLEGISKINTAKQI